MRTPMIAGNWKMNGSGEGVVELLTGIKQGASQLDSVDWVVFPPFVYLSQVQQVLQDSNVHWGGQNLSEHASGAFTGEVSASMLLDMGCQYVIVGHSERRNLYAEDNEMVAKKVLAAVKSGLKPVFCVGETEAQRQANETHQIIQNQLNAVISDGADILNNVIVAYEPVWAIGTGLTATPEQAQEVHAGIRAQVNEYDKNIAKNLRILYGGSVKPDNAEALFAMPDIDGGLIGGASLKAHDFLTIGQLCKL